MGLDDWLRSSGSTAAPEASRGPAKRPQAPRAPQGAPGAALSLGEALAMQKAMLGEALSQKEQAAIRALEARGVRIWRPGDDPWNEEEDG